MTAQAVERRVAEGEQRVTTDLFAIHLPGDIRRLHGVCEKLAGLTQQLPAALQPEIDTIVRLIGIGSGNHLLQLDLPSDLRERGEAKVKLRALIEQTGDPVQTALRECLAELR